jgi:hypothetical protein
MAWIWGSTRQIPFYHDEIAYLTQARIFASFHMYAAARPLPEFFEQYHMLVTPHFMAKYSPGQSLLLVPGIWLGIPALVPILLAGLTGALTFVLARRLANAWVALLTWLLWATAPGVLRLMPTYLSQTTTSALWLMAWWALVHWREDGRRRWLILLTVCVGCGVMTHPFTWLLFAIPIAVAVPIIGIRLRAWSSIGTAVAIGGLFVVVLCSWNAITTGNPLRFPWSVYARTYSPWDAIGFGLDSAQPLRPLPPDMARFAATNSAFHEHHTLKSIPIELGLRLRGIMMDVWGDWRLALAPFALLAFATMSAELSFALVSAMVVVAGFLLYAQPPVLPMYYVEFYPLAAFVTALGTWRAQQILSRARGSSKSTGSSAFAHSAMSMLITCALLVPLCASSLWSGETLRASLVSQRRIFRKIADSLPGDRIIVFVKYAPSHDPNSTLIDNQPDLARTRVWTVHDRGIDDVRLMHVAPNRVPYLFDEAAGAMSPLDSTGRPGAPILRLSSGGEMTQQHGSIVWPGN